MRPSSFAIVLCGVLGAACTERNPDVCCVTDAECSALGFDDPVPCATGVCVGNTCAASGCDDGGDCGDPALPVCMVGQCVSTCATPADLTCRTCAAHADCTDSDACAPDGTCAEPGEVAYVSATGGGTECSRAAPCNALALALARGTPLVRVYAGMISAAEATVIDRKVAVRGERGAILTQRGTGPVLQLAGAADAWLYDLEIASALDADGDGIRLTTGAPAVVLDRVVVRNNQRFGVLAGATGKVAVRRSIVWANTGGGIVLDGAAFELTNNLVVQNGSPTSMFGGVRLLAGDPPRVFEFNTVADNDASAMTVPVQLDCGFSPLVGANNIVIGAQPNEVGTSCTLGFTLLRAGSDVSGTTNRVGEPGFLDKSNPADPRFYRIGGASAAIDVADPDSALAVDLDGDARPQGNGRDMGADELRP